MSEDPRAEVVKQTLLELKARAEAAERERDAAVLRVEQIDQQYGSVVEQRDRALADLAAYRGRCDTLAGDAQRWMERERALREVAKDALTWLDHLDGSAASNARVLLRRAMVDGE